MPLSAMAQTGESGLLPEASGDQRPSVRFENLTVGNGLSQGSGNDLFQDSRGFIWIATQDGLNVFDGYETKVYEPVAFDSTSLSDGWSSHIHEGRDGYMWIGTNAGGLNRLDPATGVVKRYQHDPEDSTSLVSNGIWSVTEDHDGRVWVGTQDGISILDRSTETFTHLRHDHGDDEEGDHDGVSQIPAGAVHSMYVDSDNTVWAGTANGLVRIDPETREFNSYLVDLNPDLVAQSVEGAPGSIHRITELEDDPGALWMGSGKGLIRFDKTSGEIERFVTDESAVGRELRVTEVTRDPNEKDILWLGTGGRGLVRFSRSTGSFQHYRSNSADPNGLVHDDILSIHTDRSGLVWVGTNYGVSRFNPASLDFVNLETAFADLGTDEPLTPWGMYADRDGSLWVGARDAGEGNYLIKFDARTGETRRWLSDNDDLTAPGRGRMWSQYQDEDGAMWIGSGGALSRYDTARDNFRQWRHVEGDSTSIPFAWLNFLTGVRNDPDKLWLGTSRGLYQFDKATGFTRQVRITPSDTGPGYVIYASYAADGTFWVASGSHGLVRVNADESFTSYRHDRRDTTSIVTDFVMSIEERESEPGILWLATGAGLDRFDTATGKVTLHLTSQNGMPNNVMYAVRADDDGLLWASTNNGLARYDPETGEFRNFGLDSGLRGLEHMQHSHAKGPDGTLYFGHTQGITAFHPAELRHNPLPPEVAFSDFKIHNQSVLPGDDSPLKRPLNEEQTIRLSANQNVFSFDFVGLHFGNPKNNEYAYRLDGWDEDWNYVGHLRTASYTNLPAGTYKFHVKAANADGVWNEVGRAISVVVRPPWWKTWWAYVGYFLVFAGLVFAVDRIQRRRVSTKERERSRIREAQLMADAQAKRVDDAERMSEIGRAITSTLSVHGIIDTVYENVNELMDASIFAVGVYDPTTERIHFPASKEQGDTLPAYFHDANDANRLSAYCLRNREDIVIGDHQKEYQKYISVHLPPVQGESPDSIIYLPLIHQDKPVGVITAQSFEKHAYSEYHINVLRSLASYAAIALDNADAYRQLHSTVENLKSAQARLVQSEKMASLGEMTAGIAHEIKNPLNFVNNFAELNSELVDELEEHMKDGLDVKELLADLKTNASQIARHGKRADDIVRAMMQHASGGTGERRVTDINELVEEYVSLAYHGMRATDPNFNVTIERDFDAGAGTFSVVPQEVGRVFLNLLSNAFYVVREKGAAGVDGYSPKVVVRTRRLADRVEVRVADNGLGISDDVKDRIFEPFFTTKPTGSGTGLGLSLSYEIITAGHGGEMTIEETPGGGATFVVILPVAALAPSTNGPAVEQTTRQS